MKLKFKGREFWKAHAGQKVYYICDIKCDHDAAEKAIRKVLHDKVISKVGYVIGENLTIIDKISNLPKDRTDYIAVWVFAREGKNGRKR